MLFPVREEFAKTCFEALLQYSFVSQKEDNGRSLIKFSLRHGRESFLDFMGVPGEVPGVPGGPLPWEESPLRGKHLL